MLLNSFPKVGGVPRRGAGVRKRHFDIALARLSFAASASCPTATFNVGKTHHEKNLSSPDVVNACERHKVTPQKLLAIADDVRKRMLYKFGRVFVKAHSDKRVQENIRGIFRCAFHPLIAPRQLLENMTKRKALLVCAQ